MWGEPIFVRRVLSNTSSFFPPGLSHAQPLQMQGLELFSLPNIVSISANY